MEESRSNAHSVATMRVPNGQAVSSRVTSKVSVVLAVSGNPIGLLHTMKSVLHQHNIEFELIVILDGASPLIEQMLKVYARDRRLRIVRQENRGLTKSLISGCKLATHDYIARIDAGDSMELDRLSKQARVMDQNSDVGIVASWVDVRTEEGYPLYRVQDDHAALTQGLQAKSIDGFKAPVHSSVMFRKSVYKRAGGYRKDFYVSQDLDLWSRMIESSNIHVIPEVLTTTVFSSDSISARFAHLQAKMTQIVVRALALREIGKSDRVMLRKARTVRPDKVARTRHNNGDYRIASILSERSSRHAKEYWWRVVNKQPFRLKAWPRLMKSLFYRAIDEVKD